MYNRLNDENMRNNFLTDIIRRFGFENCNTIMFANRCETVNYDGKGQVRIINLYHNLMNLPVSDDE